MYKRMPQNRREWSLLGGGLLGVDEGGQLGYSRVTLFTPRGIVLKVEHDALD